MHPRTPLRRVSQGSLFALSRSGHNPDPDAPSGLGFLVPALAELADETEALVANLERSEELSRDLHRFNEGFASYLYMLNMNALTTLWAEGPNSAAYEMGARRAEEDARLAEEALKTAAAPPPPVESAPYAADGTDRADVTARSDAEASLAADTTATTMTARSGVSAGAKKKPRAKLTAKEKKERNATIEQIISRLPLAFRGNDPNLRRNMETVIERLMDSPGRGLKLPDLIAPPDLNEARARKCILALGSAKMVKSDNASGTVLYLWQGLPTGR